MRFISFMCIFYAATCGASTVEGCKTFTNFEIAAATSYLSQPKRDVNQSKFDAQAYVWSILAIRDFKSAGSLQIDIREYINQASPASHMTPLALAAFCHDLPAVKELLRLEADIEAKQGSIETPWGVIDSPSPILLALLGPNFVSDQNNETVAYLIKMNANYADAIRQLKSKYPLSNAAKVASQRNK